VNGAELADILARACAQLGEASDELRELDAVVGDGDLGITIAQGTAAVRARLAELPPDVEPSQVVSVAAEAFGSANPSTFASLVRSGLVAGSREFEGQADWSVADSIALGGVVAATMARRGKAAVGDKTVLDALVPSIDAASAYPSDGAAALAAAISAAETGIADVTDVPARKGRAAWAGERGVGVPDAGATAYLRFLQALR
jgi:dihydroxyacetone kinase-like protein